MHKALTREQPDSGSRVTLGLNYPTLQIVAATLSGLAGAAFAGTLPSNAERWSA